MNPETIEAEFRRSFGNDIPENYISLLYNMFEAIKHWCKSKSSTVERTFRFESPVIICELGILQNSLYLDYVVTRPCAQGLGIYRLLLWHLRNCVIELIFQRLEIINVMEYNKTILVRMGFHEDSDGFFYMNFPELLNVTKQTWNIPTSLPGAQDLIGSYHKNLRIIINAIHRRLVRLEMQT